jgi:lysophospholipase L1-like esterase
MAVVFIEIFLQIIKERDGWELTRSINVKRDFEFKYPTVDPYNASFVEVNYKRNEFGLRDNCSDTKDIKILTIGGSTTDQRYVPQKSTFQNVLQDRLTSSIGSFGCVSNAGVDGHSSFGHLYSFEKWFPLIPNLRPKYVILYVGINDADFRRATEPNPGHDNMYSEGWKGWLKQFEIVFRLLPIYDYLQAKQNPELAFAKHKPTPYIIEDYTENNLRENTQHLSKVNAAAFRERYARLLKFIRDMGATPVCLTQPHIFTKSIDGNVLGVRNVMENYNGIDFDYSLRSLNSEIKNLCGAMTLDLYSYKFNKEHFYDGIHTTESGSELIGNYIADFFESNDLLSGLN